MSDLLELVERTARDGAGVLPVRSDLPADPAAWREVEAHVNSVVAASPASGSGLVDAFARLATHSGSREARGRAARLSASVCAHRAEHAEAVGHYAEAVRLLRGAARDGARIGLAGSLLRLGRFDEALVEVRRARNAARRRGDGVLAAAASMNLGIALLESGDPSGALRPLEESARGFAAAGHAVHAAFARESLANAHVQLDRWDEAQEHLDHVVRVLADAGLARESAHAAYNRGVLLLVTDRLADAAATLLDAEARLEAAGDWVEGLLARIDRGEALERAGLLPEALHVIESGRTRLGRDGPPFERERARLLHARAALRAGDARLAGSLLRRAIELDAPLLCGEWHELRGRAQVLRGRRSAGQESLERAVAVYGRRHPAGRTRAQCALGWTALERGDYDTATRAARSARAGAERLRHAGLRFAAAALSFDVVRSRSSARRSLPALRRALDALELVRGARDTAALRAAVLRGSEAWFGRALRTLLDAHDSPGAALDLLERWRARALVDLLDADAERDEDEETARLRRRIATLEARADERAVPAFVRSGRLPVADARRGLASTERELAARVAADRTHADVAREPRPLGALIAGLPEDALVVSLFSDAAGTLAFLVDRSGVRVAELPGPTEVRRAVDDLHFQLGAFELGAAAVAGRARRLRRRTDAALARQAEALAPVLATICDAGTRDVRIAPHGPWQRVPFGALPTADGLLLQDVAVVTLIPSIDALVPAVSPPDRGSVVVARHDRDAPAIVAEADAVAGALARDGRPVRRLDGAGAGVDDVLELLRDTGPPGTVHVAAHGRFRVDLPALSGVRLHDGWLRALDLARIDLSGALVVLSGCETGRVDDTSGEVQGLVRAVLASGALDLVVALWPVDDATTARVMAAFHERRADGLEPSRALSSVQRELAADGLHPWYWAGFTVWTRRLPSA